MGFVEILITIDYNDSKSMENKAQVENYQDYPVKRPDIWIAWVQWQVQSGRYCIHRLVHVCAAAQSEKGLKQENAEL